MENREGVNHPEREPFDLYCAGLQRLEGSENSDDGFGILYFASMDH